MKQYLLLIFLLLPLLSAQAQVDTVNNAIGSNQKGSQINPAETNINIYPVPVRDNSFTIKSDREIYAIKITNIIGQDIFRVQYSSPQFISKIVLENPRRGMYLVAIVFSDDTRVVKKIMVEGVY
jgi:hypothetical protein